MAIWRREHGRARASRHTLEMLDDIERRLGEYPEPRPSVASIRIGAGLHDSFDFETEIEIAPGAIVAVRYQSVDEEGRDPDYLEGEGGAVAWETLNAVKDFHELGAGFAADTLHDMRVHARKIFAQWSAAGVHATFGDIRFVRTEYSRDEDALVADLRYRGLNDWLRPALHSFEIQEPSELEDILAAYRPSIAAQFATKADLARNGADGFADRMVLNAIVREWEVGAALRALARGQYLSLSEALTFYMSNGHLRCHGRSPGGELSWNKDRVDLHGLALPDTAAAALIGRPITDLVTHSVLSDDMIISDVGSTGDYGGHAVRVTIEQPTLMFCGASGRVWSRGA